MTQKTKPTAKRGAIAQKPAKLKAAGGKATLARLEADNSALAGRLAVAEQQIALLERQRDEALNRIAWVIDSINSLAESVR
ncbi:MAG: hypothetical protein ABL904_26440 [Hyphomicrobiaceae bacterium]